jgi:hypothetical protein
MTVLESGWGEWARMSETQLSRITYKFAKPDEIGKLRKEVGGGRGRLEAEAYKVEDSFMSGTRGRGQTGG